ncbi:MAG: cytochrome b N-terminal domain-containing protein [Verrucomicrobia bacterium]|nr:cytochrome b N-terminal domain-containing protein [Verrucomicrobiota bacterium]
MKKVFDWIDNRTGARKLTQEALYENVPGGARWRYIWGSTLTFTLFIQFVTGIFLWMAYSPGSQSAWASVYYIQHEMTGGWLLRGIHHFTAQAMTILLVLHLMQVVVDGAYKAPREVNFWFGLILLLLVLGLSLTGYLLPWDQKGYWATRVATNIAAITPIIGPSLQKLIVGGSDYGHHTLTRFFALHAGVLPAMIIALLVGHIYLFRKHGITAKKPYRKPDAAFWPDQVLKDAVACMAVLAAILFFVLRYRGAELAAPADGSEPYSAARPEWYFLFLFQFLKYFPGGTEIWGAIVIPTVLVIIVFAMPFIGNWKLGHRFNIGFLIAVMGGAGLLTYLAYAEDGKNPSFALAVKEAHRDAARVKILAQAPSGIPDSGAATLLRNDALTQGPKLFAKNCATCHRYDGHDGTGLLVADPSSGPDLKGFASREWIAGLMDPEKISTPHYYGGTKFENGKMARFVKKSVAEFSPEEREQLHKVILALSAEANLKSQAEVDKRDIKLIEEGRTLMANETMRCAECHKFHQYEDEPNGPDLTGYGSRDWLIQIIANPAHERFYGDRNDRMPAFADEGIMTAREIEMIAEWMRGEWYEPESASGAQ